MSNPKRNDVVGLVDRGASARVAEAVIAFATRCPAVTFATVTGPGLQALGAALVNYHRVTGLETVAALRKLGQGGAKDCRRCKGREGEEL